MTSDRDGHIHVLPLHVANKIAAGEVVERPASVAKELVENAIDAGAKKIAISILQGGRKLVAVQDDGCGMTKDDALLSLERQATSKILDVHDIEQIDTLGFRGEAIPSIASVSRFTLTTRRADSDEGTRLQVDAGVLTEVSAAGCPVGTLVEVKDLFCNVPARRKFLRAYATEESHVRNVFTIHALAHPEIGFSLSVDGHEVYRLAPTDHLEDRVRDLFGEEFLEQTFVLEADGNAASTQDVTVTGYIERPNRATPTRHSQYIFVNARPASAPSIAYAIKEAYPHQPGDSRPAAILFITLPPGQVDVNVHPTKREVRFRDNGAVKLAIGRAIERALMGKAVGGGEIGGRLGAEGEAIGGRLEVEQRNGKNSIVQPSTFNLQPKVQPPATSHQPPATLGQRTSPSVDSQPPAPQPIAVEFAIEPDSTRSKPWQWFRFLAQSASGYLLIETDSGIVTINPHAARERIAYEQLLKSSAEKTAARASQTLLIPETVQLSPVDAARIRGAADTIRAMGFQLEEFGHDVFKIDAIPQLIGSLSPTAILSTVARDLSEGTSRRNGERWREELIAKSIAKSFAGASMKLTEEGAVRLVEELCACRMPYVCPRGKPVMIFTSTRELDRKFDRK